MWNDPFIIINVLLCLLWQFFNLFILSIPPFFSLAFAWNRYFYFFIFRLCVFFNWKWVSCREHMFGFCFLPIKLLPINFLFGDFNLFTFKVITGREGITIPILFIVFCVPCSYFLSYICFLYICSFFVVTFFCPFSFPFVHFLYIFSLC